MIASLPRFVVLLLASLSLLLIPFCGIILSSEVNWTAFDFVVMAVLLSAVAVGIEGVLRIASTARARVMLVAGVVLLFLVVWAELAVGVFGTPLAGN